MASWFKSFLTGYQKVQTLNDEDNLNYQDVKKDLSAIIQFKESEEKTRALIVEIKEYLSKFVGKDSEDEIPQKDKVNVVARAKKYGETMKKFSEEFYNDFAIVASDPERVKVKISMVEERVGRFRTHGRYLLVLGVILFTLTGGLVASQIYGLKDYAHMGMVVAGGFTVGVLVFSLIYFGFLAQQKKNLARWKELQKDMSKEEDIKEDIVKKRPITRALHKLLLDINADDDDIVFLLEDIVTQCDNYLSE